MQDQGVEKFNRNQLPHLTEEVIVQQFYPEIVNGEISLFYFNKKFAYACRKTPKKGEIRVQEEFGGKITAYQPTQDELKWAEDILNYLPYRWLYARVDILPGKGLMELECIEPSLYFDVSPNGVHQMADAISNISV
ncbi:MAG: hypothetical protein R2827_12935 [Bdellovibrionales bacterium]